MKKLIIIITILGFFAILFIPLILASPLTTNKDSEQLANYPSNSREGYDFGSAPMANDEHFVEDTAGHLDQFLSWYDVPDGLLF